jgi:hypothetical protein
VTEPTFNGIERETTFVLSDEPIVRETHDETRLASDDLGELPRSYGGPLLVAIARDPKTLFAYWDVDWPATFGDSPPPDRTVHLRVLDGEGTELSTTAVEPLAGTCYVSVLNSDSAYRVELGYFQRAGEWNVVVVSEPVITPRDRVAETGDFQLATIPLHLKFQQIVDAFRGSKFDGQALATMIAELQQVAESASDRGELGPTDAQLLESIGLRFSESEARDRADFRNLKPDERALWARIERILVGATSPANGFGDSSRS